YERNEQAVRDQIINPLLRNLGWDIENPEDVQPNVSIDEGIPDYSLLRNGR
ncbi:MAG: restriction endonuclease, partial [Methanomicrobiales archaeon HGW-Methanomicrobiales-5]